MKKLSTVILTLALTLVIYAYPVAACGEQGHGSKCLVGSPPVVTSPDSKKVKKPFDFDKEISWLLRDILIKILG